MDQVRSMEKGRSDQAGTVYQPRLPFARCSDVVTDAV